jgi:hypothetical protein
LSREVACRRLEEVEGWLDIQKHEEGYCVSEGVRKQNMTNLIISLALIGLLALILGFCAWH